MLKRIVGLVLVILSLSALGIWEFWGREALTYETILVLNRDVNRNAVITEEMVTEVRVERPAPDVLRPEDRASILDRVALQYVPGGTPLYAAYFEDPSLAVGGGSGQYILSIPAAWLMAYPQTLRRGDTVRFYCEGSLVVTATVAYARDSSNQEVVSGDDSRLGASAPVSLVEVIVDEERALRLGRLADAGKRFVLLYC